MKLIVAICATALAVPNLAFAQARNAAEEELSGYANALASGDCETALSMLNPLVNAGRPLAQLSLSNLYDTGQCVQQDKSKAFQLQLLVTIPENEVALADSGFSLASLEANIGRRFDFGDGVQKSATDAVKWYLSSADKGNAQSQFNLGIHYYNGSGVEQDFVLAYAWIKIASLNSVDVHANDSRVKYTEVAAKAKPNLSDGDLLKAEDEIEKCVKQNFANCMYVK